MDVSEPIVFLSYARADAAVVKRLYKLLQLAGFKPWVDIEDILPGQDWKRRIETAIRSAPIFLACVSTHSLNRRGMIQVELREALQVWQQKLVDDVYLIPVRLEDCAVPDTLSGFHWVDFFEKDGSTRLLDAIRHQVVRLGLVQKLTLRSHPSELRDPRKMLQERGFFCKINNWRGEGIRHHYEVLKRGRDSAILDHATGLLWQQAGSETPLCHDDSLSYVARINETRFFQLNGWRFPTLEEAMSLMEPKQSEIGLHIAGVFSETQFHIWTADGIRAAKVFAGEGSTTGYGPEWLCWIAHYFSAFCVVAPASKAQGHGVHMRAVCTWP